MNMHISFYRFNCNKSHFNFIFCGCSNWRRSGWRNPCAAGDNMHDMCVCVYFLCKKLKQKGASERVHKPPQPAPAQTEVPSGGTKIIVIQDSRPQNIMMPPVHYAQDPYYNTPQFEPYPAHPPYPIPPDGMGFPQHQSYNADPSSYFQGAPSATPYKPKPIPRKVPSAPRRQ